MEEKIKATVVSISMGLQTFEDLQMIRVKSNHHTLLIMKNFMPVIGELDGSVEFVFDQYTEQMNNIKGYYMHKKNEFSLIVSEGDTDTVRVVEE